MQIHFCFTLLLNSLIDKTAEHEWMTKRGTDIPSLAFTVIHNTNSKVSVFYMHRYSTLVSTAEMCDT